MCVRVATIWRANMNRNALLIIAVMVFCAGFIACHSGGGTEGTIGEIIAGPTETAEPTETAAPTATLDPQEAHNNECLGSIAGKWNYSTPTASGTMTFDSNGAMTGITISSCPSTTLDGSMNATVEDGVVNIIYNITCAGERYAYVMLVNYATGTCSKMSGTKGYYGAQDESITLTK